MITTPITADLHMISLGGFQSYALLGPHSLTLIDAGAAGSAPQIARGLRELGRAPADTTSLVLTHFHDDHAGAAGEIAGWEGPIIVAHENDAPFVRGDVPGPEPRFTAEEKELHAAVSAGLPTAPPSRVDLEVRADDVLTFDEEIRVLWTPGHTDGSIAIHLPRQRALLVGDTVAELGGTLIPGVFNLDVESLHVSIRSLADLDVDIVCFGHGEPVLEDGSAVLHGVASALGARG